MAWDLLPRGNVRKFEHWLLLRVCETSRRLEFFKEKGASEHTVFITAGDLSASLAILAEYTDRDPYEMSKVASDYRALVALIRNGSSFKKQIEKQVNASLRKEEGS